MICPLNPIAGPWFENGTDKKRGNGIIYIYVLIMILIITITLITIITIITMITIMEIIIVIIITIYIYTCIYTPFLTSALALAGGPSPCAARLARGP